MSLILLDCTRYVATQRFLRGGSELREESLVGRCFGDQGEPEEVVLGPRDRSGPPSRPADPAAADAGAAVHTDPRFDRADRQYPTRHPDLPPGGVRHRDAGDDSDGSGQNGHQDAAGEIRSGFFHLHQWQHVEVESDAEIRHN